MRRLTIVSVAFPFAPVSADPVGGAEQVLASIDRALVRAGHRSIVIASEGSAPAGELVSVPPPRNPIEPVEWGRAHDYLRATIAQVMRESRADLLHMHGIDFNAYLPRPGVPVLATLHMPLDCYAPGTLEPERPRTWFNTVSGHQHAGTRPNARLVGAIENGVRIGIDTSARRKRSFSLAMGRICPEKGFHLALEATKAAHADLRLAGQVFGFPEHQRYFDQEIRPRLDSDRRWIGPIGGARKWRLLQSARCLLAPSLVAETASLVAREALAAGTPVIAYPSGALADTVEPGVTGFLVRNVEDMARALENVNMINPETCRSIARERYSVDRMTKEYFDLYDRLLQVD